MALVLKNYISVMGEPLGTLFHSLWQEVAWLHRRWHEYVELYGSKPSHIDLLHKAAPGFFRIVQDTIWEATLLHITRLTDHPCTGDKENLTIRRLPLLVRDATAKQCVKIKQDEAIKAAAFCRDWRNRRIAHSDLSLALDEHPEPLSEASYERVSSAISAIADVLNVVQQHYMGSTSFFNVSGYPSGAVSLLYVIDDGLRAEAERPDRLKRGEVRPDDYHDRNL